MIEAVSDALVNERKSSLRKVSDELNQRVRRLRQASSIQELGSVLVDTTAGFCRCAAFFVLKGGVAQLGAVRGIRQNDGLEFPIKLGAAFAGVAETREPAVAAATAGELTAEVVNTCHLEPTEKVCLFPLAVRHHTVAVLLAYGAVDMPALELLTETASAFLASYPSAPSALQPLVEITPVLASAAHLRAQRFARVAVAELILYRPKETRAGRLDRSLYSALQPDIDASRKHFREKYLRNDPSMVDYLHVELVRRLANDDVSLLGENYPGPLA